MTPPNFNFICPRCVGNRWGESSVNGVPHGFCKGRDCLLIWPRSDDHLYHHELKPAMTQPQSPDEELKDILKQNNELLREGSAARESFLSNWEKAINLADTFRIRAEISEKRLSDAMAENKLYREALAKNEAEIVRLKTDKTKLESELVARYEDLRKLQLPYPEPAWEPKFKVGDRVRVIIPTERREGRISDVGANKLYQLAEDRDTSGVWFQEDELEPISWSPTPPPFGKWHRSDGWKEEWLKDGWRPLLEGEKITNGDECLCTLPNSYWGECCDFVGKTTSQRYSRACGVTMTEFYLRTKRHLPEDPSPPPGKHSKARPSSLSPASSMCSGPVITHFPTKSTVDILE